MAEGDFQVVFRGELTGELSEEEVRQRLASLFKMPEAKVAGLFTGKPIVVKRNLDEATARKFEAAFGKAGAKCEIGSASAGAEPEPSAQPTREQAAEQADEPSAGAHGSGSSGSAGASRRESIAAAGDPNRTMLEMEVPSDLSGLDVDTSEAPLSPGEEIPEPDIDIGELSVDENDSRDLSESKPPPPADIDTSELSLEDPDR